MVYFAPSRKLVRQYHKKKRAMSKSKPRTQFKRGSSKGLTRVVKKVMNRIIETKKSVVVNTNRSTIYHNQLLILDSSPFKTSQGTQDPNTGGILQNRIGDRVNPVGLSIKFMVCLDPRQQHCHFRWLFIRAPLGQVPSWSTLFDGAVDNKRIDSVNTQKWKIIQQKYFSVYRPNPSIGGTDYTMNSVNDGLVNPTGNYVTAGAQDQSYVSKPISCWIPGSKLGRVMQYDEGGQTPQFYSYYSVLLSYTSYKATTYNAVGLIGTVLGTMEDYVSKFYYKDP